MNLWYTVYKTELAASDVKEVTTMAAERASDVLTSPAPIAEENWPKQGEWTYADYKRLPDDGWRYEVIEGASHTGRYKL